MKDHSQAVENRFEAAYIAAGMPSTDSWYHEANVTVKSLADKHDIDFKVCAGIVAALSPRIRWQTAKGNGYPNLEAAENLIRGYRHHKAKSVVFANVAGFNHNKEKAWQMLRENSTEALSGPKVTAFYNNIVNPDNDDNVTIDSWMIAIAYGLSFTDSKENYAPSGMKEYDDVKQCLINVAQKYAISAVDFQAIVWQWAKESSGHWRTM